MCGFLLEHMHLVIWFPFHRNKSRSPALLLFVQLPGFDHVTINKFNLVRPSDNTSSP